MSILFDDIVFGPVNSRRMGKSLGINLLPLTHKICSFDCVYCECGWTMNTEVEEEKLIRGDELLRLAEEGFIRVVKNNIAVDAITFAGNGEPSLHPDFPQIIEGIIALRDKYLQHSKIAVLSNASMLHKADVVNVLSKIWYNIQKLDAGSERMFRLINRPPASLSLNEVVENLCRFEGKLMIQTLLLRGEIDGKYIDNTTEEEVELWISHVVKIKPRYVMLYPIHRAPPSSGLQKIEPEVFEAVKKKLEKAGVDAKIYF